LCSAWLTFESIGGAAADASKFGAGDACAICLGELCGTVELPGSHGEGATPTSAAATARAADAAPAPVVVVQPAPKGVPGARGDGEAESSEAGMAPAEAAAAEKIAEAGKKVGALVAVDNTFMSPIFQRPLELGADLVMHSMTKYLNGHSDVVGGCLILNNDQLYKKLWTLQNSIGPSQSPFDSWLVLRGLKTLKIRMSEHQKNAQVIADYLEKHPQVEKVIYPGLKSHPQYDLATKQMHGFSGMITFFLKGGLEESKTFLESVQLFALAESLGGVESLIEHPAIMTHASVPVAQREKLGIKDNLIRISVGIEDIADLTQDLINAFEAVKKKHSL